MIIGDKLEEADESVIQIVTLSVLVPLVLAIALFTTVGWLFQGRTICELASSQHRIIEKQQQKIR